MKKKTQSFESKYENEEKRFRKQEIIGDLVVYIVSRLIAAERFFV